MRRLYHLISGLFLVLIVAHLNKEKGLLFVSFLFFSTVTLEVLRLLLPNLNRIFLQYLGLLLRQEEEHQPTGTGFYLGGILISLLLFEREIALFSMTLLAVGDPAASFFGKRWGRHRLGEKSFEGSTAFFMASIGAGLILYGLWPGLPLEVIITGAAAATLAELISIKINDNLIIPLAAAGVMQAMLSLLHFITLK